MTVFDVKLQGADVLEKTLLRLERNVGKKIVRKAVRAGAKPVLAAIKSAANSMVGGTMGRLISKNLQTRGFKKQKRGQFGVGTRLKADIPEFVDVSADGSRQYIPAAIEFGHVDRGGGQVPAIPFMRTSFDMTKHKSERIVSITLAREILLAAKAK